MTCDNLVVSHDSPFHRNRFQERQRLMHLLRSIKTQFDDAPVCDGVVSLTKGLSPRQANEMDVIGMDMGLSPDGAKVGALSQQVAKDA